jgi:hypothetical protein
MAVDWIGSIFDKEEYTSDIRQPSQGPLSGAR